MVNFTDLKDIIEQDESAKQLSESFSIHFGERYLELKHKVEELQLVTKRVTQHVPIQTLEQLNNELDKLLIEIEAIELVSRNFKACAEYDFDSNEEEINKLREVRNRCSIGSERADFMRAQTAYLSKIREYRVHAEGYRLIMLYLSGK